MANKKTWTEEEIQFVKDNYMSMTQREIAEKLNRTTSSVNIKASKLGLKKELYYCDYNFFKEIKTEEQAYWLGFIYADGYVTFNEKSGAGTLGIDLQRSDEPHLRAFNKAIKGNYKIIQRERVCNINGKTYSQSSLRIYSKIMADDLVKQGCAPRKTNIISLPELSEELMPHFIRGFFDGDGCVTECRKKEKGRIYYNIRYDFTCNSEQFVNELRTYLYKVGVCTYIAKEEGRPYRLCVSGKENGKKFHNYIYQNSIINLERKFKKSIAVLSKCFA